MLIDLHTHSHFSDGTLAPAELVARIRAVLRRIRPALADEALSYADLYMDLVGHRLTRAGKPIHLGPTEFRLLRHFMEHPGRVFSREQLLDVFRDAADFWAERRVPFRCFYSFQ